MVLGPEYGINIYLNGQAVAKRWNEGVLARRSWIAPGHKKVLGASDGFGDVRHKGTVDYIVPPWTIKYWKNRKWA